MPEISVLLVEDDEVDVFYINKLLKETVDVRFEVQHATTLKAALTALGAKDYDLVLLDLSLPDYHGYDTVVEYTKNTNTPFIVLTQNDDVQMAIRAVNLGAEDYILKGDLHPRKLEMALTLAARRHQARSVAKKLEHSSRTMVFEGDRDKATVSMLRPHVEELVLAFEDLEGYLRQNAPGVMDDVKALMAKHNIHAITKELRDVLRLHNMNQSSSRKKKISDHAMKVADDVVRKRRPSEPPVDFSAAEADLLDVISRREELDHG